MAGVALLALRGVDRRAGGETAEAEGYDPRGALLAATGPVLVVRFPTQIADPPPVSSILGSSRIGSRCVLFSAVRIFRPYACRRRRKSSQSTRVG